MHMLSEINENLSNAIPISGYNAIQNKSERKKLSTGRTDTTMRIRCKNYFQFTVVDTVNTNVIEIKINQTSAFNEKQRAESLMCIIPFLA